MSELYQIFALKYAEDTTRTHAQCFVSSTDTQRLNPLNYYVWVIQNERRTICVDTGFGRTEASARGRDLSIEPADALRQLNIEADALDDVIITHLHYDHAGTLPAFPNATFHLQEAEMRYATGPCMCEGHLREPFTADHVCEMVQAVYSGRVHFRDGDGAIAPGITVHKIGGHSRGLQAVRVMTERGPVVLASDAAHFYENYEQRSPFVIVVDMEDMLAGYTRLTELADGDPTRVIPGHDPRVFDRYPAMKDATAGSVHRLDLAPIA